MLWWQESPVVQPQIQPYHHKVAGMSLQKVFCELANFPKTMYYAAIPTCNPWSYFLILGDSFPTILLFQHSLVVVQSSGSVCSGAEFESSLCLWALMLTLAHRHFPRSTSQLGTHTPALPSELMCLHFFGLWPWVFLTLTVTSFLSQPQPDPTTEPNPPMSWLSQRVIRLLWISAGTMNPQIGEEVGSH